MFETASEFRRTKYNVAEISRKSGILLEKTSPIQNKGMRRIIAYNSFFQMHLQQRLLFRLKTLGSSKMESPFSTASLPEIPHRKSRGSKMAK
jgi:hypothetical protein